MQSRVLLAVLIAAYVLLAIWLGLHVGDWADQRFPSGTPRSAPGTA
jgi:hypothetical protein